MNPRTKPDGYPVRGMNAARKLYTDHYWFPAVGAEATYQRLCDESVRIAGANLGKWTNDAAEANCPRCLAIALQEVLTRRAK